MARSFCTCMCCLLLLTFTANVAAQAGITVPSQEKIAIMEQLEALRSILSAKKNLNESLGKYQRELKSAVSDTEKRNLLDKINILERELLDSELNFDSISTNTNLSATQAQNNQNFSLQEELVQLIKPTIQEMNHLTSDVRRKSELREKIDRSKKKQEEITEAITHLSGLLSLVDADEALKMALSEKANYWIKQHALLDSRYKSATQQLKKIESEEVSFTESTQNYFKEFFQRRGLYILQAILAMLTIFFITHLLRAFLKKILPAFTQHSRSFQMRLLDLLHRIITFILIVVSPVIVFYLAEDWVLFSFSLLLLLGIVWTLRTVVPEYRKQIQLFLNVGAVREGERVLLDGIPWRVASINVFSVLENPVAGIKQRIPIKDLIDLKSRPGNSDEPWFPCTKGDWVILSDGVRGKVVGISGELVKLVQRGGAHKTYLTNDFLSLAPQNLSVNFRIKETIGISYDLQAISTIQIPKVLQKTLLMRIREEGYADDLLNLRVEFAYANTSSLDLVVIADFKGNLADLYNRLRRAIQRWCVDACTENNWEIPFTQISIHQ